MHLNPVLILLGLTVAVSMYAWSTPQLMSDWVLAPYHMRRSGGQWYRLLTSGFLHANWGHLLFNMLAFYSFGGTALTYFASFFGDSAGVLAFLALYLGGIIASDLPTYFRHRDDPGYRSLGASGGVSAVVFASILFYPVAPSGQGILIFPLPFPLQPFLFGFLYLAYSHYMGRRRGDNINHDAHFYGALFGVLLTLALVPTLASTFFVKILVYIKSF